MSSDQTRPDVDNGTDLAPGSATSATNSTSADRHREESPAEKLAALRTIDQLRAERRGNADVERARAFLQREGGEPPREGDELPAPGE